MASHLLYVFTIVVDYSAGVVHDLMLWDLVGDTHNQQSRFQYWSLLSAIFLLAEITFFHSINHQQKQRRQRIYKLWGKLLKQVRQFCRDYQEMLEDGGHIMVCVLGGKYPATLLYLLWLLQQQLPISIQLIRSNLVTMELPWSNGSKTISKFLFKW